MPEEKIQPSTETHDLAPADKAKEGELAEISPSIDSGISNGTKTAGIKLTPGSPISVNRTRPAKRKQPVGVVILLIIGLIIILVFVLNFFKIINIGQFFKFGNNPNDRLVIDSFSSGDNNQNLKTSAEKRDLQRKANLASLAQALENFKTRKQEGYPKTFVTITQARLPLIGETDSQNIINLSESGNILEKSLVPDFLKSLPQDPKQGNYYSYTSDGLRYKIAAVSETGTNCDELSGDLCLFVVKNNP